eukprot:11095625-Lingulodinium_polyedra.AAC.1
MSHGARNVVLDALVKGVAPQRAEGKIGLVVLTDAQLAPRAHRGTVGLEILLVAHLLRAIHATSVDIPRLALLGGFLATRLARARYAAA